MQSNCSLTFVVSVKNLFSSSVKAVERIMSLTLSPEYLCFMLSLVLFVGSAVLFNLCSTMGDLFKSCIIDLKSFEISDNSFSRIVNYFTNDVSAWAYTFGSVLLVEVLGTAFNAGFFVSAVLFLSFLVLFCFLLAYHPFPVQKAAVKFRELDIHILRCRFVGRVRHCQIAVNRKPRYSGTSSCPTDNSPAIVLECSMQMVITTVVLVMISPFIDSFFQSLNFYILSTPFILWISNEYDFMVVVTGAWVVVTRVFMKLYYSGLRTICEGLVTIWSGTVRQYCFPFLVAIGTGILCAVCPMWPTTVSKVMFVLCKIICFCIQIKVLFCCSRKKSLNLIIVVFLVWWLLPCASAVSPSNNQAQQPQENEIAVLKALLGLTALAVPNATPRQQEPIPYFESEDEFEKAAQTNESGANPTLKSVIEVQSEKEFETAAAIDSRKRTCSGVSVGLVNQSSDDESTHNGTPYPKRCKRKYATCFVDDEDDTLISENVLPAHSQDIRKGDAMLGDSIIRPEDLGKPFYADQILNSTSLEDIRDLVKDKCKKEEHFKATTSPGSRLTGTLGKRRLGMQCSRAGFSEKRRGVRLERVRVNKKSLAHGVSISDGQTPIPTPTTIKKVKKQRAASSLKCGCSWEMWIGYSPEGDHCVVRSINPNHTNGCKPSISQLKTSLIRSGETQLRIPVSLGVTLHFMFQGHSKLFLPHTAI